MKIKNLVGPPASAQPPGYAEAYPMFSIGEARRELIGERDHLIWRDRHSIVSGAAWVRWAGPAGMILRYTFEERGELPAFRGELNLSICWKGPEVSNERPFAPCPLCSRNVDVLVFTRSWHCVGARHGLRHRSTLLAKEVRWTEELEKLEGALATMAAVGRGSRKREPLLAKRAIVLAKLGTRATTANALLLEKTTREWVSPASFAKMP